MIKNIFVGAGGALLFSAVAAQAVPITTPPPVLSAVGDVQAVYVFADALNTSVLNEVTPSSINQIFCNHSTGGCVGAAAGQTVDLLVQSGPMVFSLNNLTTGNTFTSAAADVNGNYHVMISSNFSIFNVGALPSAAATVIAALVASGDSVTYVGFEDAVAADNSDFDYNDLIFAFANTVSSPSGVPEPLTISLFGMGLAGAAYIGRRRKNKQA